MISTNVFKPLLFGGMAAVFLATGSSAQNLIKMDSAGCGGGLEALSKVASVQINSTSEPRKVIGKCEAQGVLITSDRAQVTIEVDRLQWNRNGLTPLASGKLPEMIKLELSGVRVTSAPQRDPAWVYLASEGAAGQKFDALLAFSFKPKTGALDMSAASLDFHNGNTARLTAKLRGLSPAQAKAPELAVLTMIVDELTLTISSGAGRKNPAMALGVAVLQGKIANGDLEAFKTSAIGYIAKEMAAVLDGDGIRAMQKMVADLPKPQGGLRLNLKASGGFPAMRLGLLANGNKPADALEGVDVDFQYEDGISR